MGKLIESLRHSILQEEQIAAQKEAENLLREARKQQLERERMLQRRAKNRLHWEASRKHFHESGVLGLLQEVVDLGGARGIYVDPESFDKLLWWKEAVGNPCFHAELHIKEARKEQDEHYFTGGHSDKITTRYISVDTDQDGTVSFCGKLLPFDLTVRVPKAKWEEDKGVLEKALGKVYHHPQVSINREFHNMRE